MILSAEGIAHFLERSKTRKWETAAEKMVF